MTKVSSVMSPEAWTLRQISVQEVYGGVSSGSAPTGREGKRTGQREELNWEQGEPGCCQGGAVRSSSCPAVTQSG